MDRDSVGTDMGDDDQADEIRAFERNVEDPSSDRRVRYYESEDDGRLGIGDELDQEWTRRDRRADEQEQDDRPAEVAAMEIVDEDDL